MGSRRQSRLFWHDRSIFPARRRFDFEGQFQNLRGNCNRTKQMLLIYSECGNRLVSTIDTQIGWKFGLIWVFKAREFLHVARRQSQYFTRVEGNLNLPQRCCLGGIWMYMVEELDKVGGDSAMDVLQASWSSIRSRALETSNFITFPSLHILSGLEIINLTSSRFKETSKQWGDNTSHQSVALILPLQTVKCSKCILPFPSLTFKLRDPSNC